jgi:hypothetical protein
VSGAGFGPSAQAGSSKSANSPGIEGCKRTDGAIDILVS